VSIAGDMLYHLWYKEQSHALLEVLLPVFGADHSVSCV
jgi:hypothetical protein